MKQQKLQQAPANLILEGYDTYAVLKGGNNVIKFSDNTDITTDKNTSAIEVTPKGKAAPIKFMQRGRNNNMPYDIMKKIGINVTVGSNIEFKNKVVFGDSILVYRKYRDKATKKIIKEEVLPEEQPEIFEFLENNNFNFIRMELANDLVIFYDGYLEYIFNNDDKSPRIVQIKAKESTCSRISEIDEKTGKSEWHGYSAEWHKGTPEDLVATPLLDRQSPLLDLKIRIGLAPNNNGKTIVGKDRRFIHNLRISTPGRFYYSHPYWWSVFASGWYDFSSAIPVFKKSLIKNQMALRYIIYIQETFWEKLYASEKIVKDDEKAIRRGKFLQDMNDFLAGEENAGKGFISHFRYDRIKGIEDNDILRDEYDIQIEFGDIGNILAYLSIGDRAQEVERLVSALAEIRRRFQTDGTGLLSQEYIDPQVVTSPQDAFYADKCSLPLRETEGMVCSEFVMCYPPGIQILAHGELITEEILDYI